MRIIKSLESVVVSISISLSFSLSAMDSRLDGSTCPSPFNTSNSVQIKETKCTEGNSSRAIYTTEKNAYAATLLQDLQHYRMRIINTLENKRDKMVEATDNELLNEEKSSPKFISLIKEKNALNELIKKMQQDHPLNYEQECEIISSPQEFSDEEEWSLISSAREEGDQIVAQEEAVKGIANNLSTRAKIKRYLPFDPASRATRRKLYVISGTCFAAAAWVPVKIPAFLLSAMGISISTFVLAEYYRVDPENPQELFPL